jgi:hypothetical protein
VVRSTGTTRSNSTTPVAQRGEKRCSVGDAAAHHVDDEELVVQQILDPPDVPAARGGEERVLGLLRRVGRGSGKGLVIHLGAFLDLGSLRR